MNECLLKFAFMKLLYYKKTFQICHKIESKDVFIDMCTILITHFKEYKKALKRQEKSPDTHIETLYKTSHPVSDVNRKNSTADHCTNIVRMLMKDLIPYELWYTPHAELLVRILSKRLDAYIENTIADPVWINDRIVTYLTGEEYVETDKKDKEGMDYFIYLIISCANQPRPCHLNGRVQICFWVLWVYFLHLILIKLFGRVHVITFRHCAGYNEPTTVWMTVCFNDIIYRVGKHYLTKNIMRKDV